MHVKTKQPVLIDAQNDISDIVYFKKLGMDVNDLEGVVQLPIGLFVKKGENYHRFGIIPSLFKKTTFNALFGNMTFNQFEANIPNLMIQQFDFLSNKEWDGTEVMQPVKLWGLNGDDFEIVPNA